mgnify:CR=1 FL=1
MDTLLSIVCVVSGMIVTRKPELVWEIQHFFSVKNGESTEIYLKVMRGVGILMIAFGVTAFRFSAFR